MTQPVRYELRPPMFISSRLMPAVTIDDVTIHIQAVAVDHDEPADPRVVWEYIIESATLMHAGRDLTTPYHGAAAIPGQLPTAMGTLLTHLDHLADTSTDDTQDDIHPGTSMPSEVVRWARHHRNELTAVAELVDRDARQPLPASLVWRAITHDPDQTPYGRWCAGQATQQADRMATLNPRPGTAHGLVVRDELWHEHALAVYTTLAARPEPANLATLACVVAEPDSIRAWLDGPAPHTSAVSMADHLRVRDAGLDWHTIPDLIEQAQNAGLFGLAEHTIRAHPVIDDTHNTVGHVLTITTPDGDRLATAPITTDGPDPSGGPPYAVYALLRRARL